jgi:hypothetical protein
LTTTAPAKTTAATADPAAANATAASAKTASSNGTRAASGSLLLARGAVNTPQRTAAATGAAASTPLSVADGAAPVGERCERRQLEEELPRQVRRFESVHHRVRAIRACSHAVGRAESVPRGQWAAGSARDGGPELCRASTKRPAIARFCRICAGSKKAGGRLRLNRQQNIPICRYFSGSDGTRTRDLRRDRPVQAQPPQPAVTGNYWLKQALRRA